MKYFNLKDVSFSICCLIVFFTNTSLAQSREENYSRILGRFEDWIDQQYQQNIFLISEKCNPNYLSQHELQSALGIPESINVFFSDINLDTKIDALITFSPVQCDGGNALMNLQNRIFILSDNTAYIIDDYSIDKIEEKYCKNGWLMIESINSNEIKGFYYEYKPSDGRCCPSIKREVSIDFVTKELSFRE